MNIIQFTLQSLCMCNDGYSMYIQHKHALKGTPQEADEKLLVSGWSLTLFQSKSLENVTKDQIVNKTAVFIFLEWYSDFN